MSDQPNESVELDIDEEKVQAWDEVKDDYLVDPDATPDPDAEERSGDTGDEDPAQE